MKWEKLEKRRMKIRKSDIAINVAKEAKNKPHISFDIL